MTFLVSKPLHRIEITAWYENKNVWNVSVFFIFFMIVQSLSYGQELGRFDSTPALTPEK